MTGAGGGSHRGRESDPTGGVHRWGGTGPAGGGSHAVSRRRPVLLVTLAALGLLAVGGVALGVTLAGPRSEARGDAAPTAEAAPSATPSAAPTAPARVAEIVAATPLRFDADSAALTTATTSAVDRVAVVLRAEPGTTVALEGHSAPVGEATGGGVRISTERAQAVADRLAAGGVDPARLRVVGLGPTQPLTPVEASRRVEVRVG